MVGNRLIYTDTWEEAVAQLGEGEAQPAARAVAAGAPATATAAPAAGTSDAERKLQSIRNHLRLYQEHAAQGRWAEAGKELEAIEAELKR
jgi:hypothetical protein